MMPLSRKFENNGWLNYGQSRMKKESNPEWMIKNWAKKHGSIFPEVFFSRRIEIEDTIFHIYPIQLLAFAFRGGRASYVQRESSFFKIPLAS